MQPCVPARSPIARCVGNRQRNTGVGLARQLHFWAAQAGQCAICKTALSFQAAHLDHCHETGAPRGYLCGTCNKGLGLFDDSSPRLLAAIAYLASTTATSSRPAQ